MFARLYRGLLAALALTFLAACGGGSGSSSSTAPTITTQPASLTVASSASASFSVAASGSATLAYQWRRDGSAISGATATTYTIDAAATTDAGSYDVVVSNAAGSVTSSAATLTVTAEATAPAITTQPASQSVATGGSATFTVVATGAAPLAYQWRKDGTAISGAVSSSYSIAAAASSDAGTYDVVVSNTLGSVTSSAASLAVTTTTAGTLSAEVTAAAQAFMATLSTSQQASIQYDFSVDTARRWSNLPAAMVARNGISWGSLSTAQKTAARTLIATALSSAGNQLHIGMQAADNYLVSNYAAQSSSYGEGHYYMAFLGTPSASSMWMLQLSGHHLTYNIAFNATYRSPTPLFLGIEPKADFTSGGTAYDPMLAQRTAMDDLATALASYSDAKLSGSYGDLLFGANGSGGIDGTMPKSYPSGTSDRGVLYGSLSAADQAKVEAVIRSYVDTQASEIADELLTAYLSDAALAQTYVAYAGSGTVTTSGSYFRIDGPRVWIEWSVQNGVLVQDDIHPHTVWRDKVGDYGG